MIGTALTVLAATVSATPFEGKYFSGVATDPNGTAFLTHLDAARRMFSAGDSELMTFTGVYLPSSEEELSCHWWGGWNWDFIVLYVVFVTTASAEQVRQRALRRDGGIRLGGKFLDTELLWCGIREPAVPAPAPAAVDADLLPVVV